MTGNDFAHRAHAVVCRPRKAPRKSRWLGSFVTYLGFPLILASVVVGYVLVREDFIKVSKGEVRAHRESDQGPRPPELYARLRETVIGRHVLWPREGHRIMRSTDDPIAGYVVSLVCAGCALLIVICATDIILHMWPETPAGDGPRELEATRSRR